MTAVPEIGSAEALDIDFSDLEAKYSATLNENYDNILIIDHLPKVDPSKEEKLLAVLKKNIFVPANAKIVEGGVFMPRGDDGSLSKGYMFVEVETAEQAEAVYRIAHGYRLDKQHVLYAIRFGEFDRLKCLEETYKEPVVEAFEEKEYLREWLKDPMARDQFLTLAGVETSVWWNNRGGQSPELVMSRKNWTDSYVQWSTRGSYMATMHGPGIMLWGGKSWSKLGRFPHVNVKMIAFSNGETFMVSWSPFDPAKPNEPHLLVWDVPGGKLVRGFVVEESGSVNWPMVKFSQDDKYAARAHDGLLSIYETPSFGLMDKRSLKIEGIKEISWSPVDDTLVYWTPGTDDNPARVALMQVPSKLVIRTKNLFNVSNCQIFWQSEAHYLAVQVDRYGKNRKNVTSNLELFRLRDKNIPVEVLEFKDTTIAAFAWEPAGDRFMVTQTAEFKNVVAFYTMKAVENGMLVVKPLKTLERKQITKYSWAPNGDFMVMAGLDTTSAFLEFWNVTDFSLLATKEHFMATDYEWDPTGRYVASWVSYWKHQSENGFVIFDFKGEVQSKISLGRLCSFAWRPRPPSLVSKERQKDIRRNLKEHAKDFEEQDRKASSRESSSVSENKERTVHEWNEWRQRCTAAFQRRVDKRADFTDGAGEPMQTTKVVEEWVEEVVEEAEEILPESDSA